MVLDGLSPAWAGMAGRFTAQLPSSKLLDETSNNDSAPSQHLGLHSLTGSFECVTDNALLLVFSSTLAIVFLVPSFSASFPSPFRLGLSKALASDSQT